MKKPSNGQRSNATATTRGTYQKPSKPSVQTNRPAKYTAIKRNEKTSTYRPNFMKQTKSGAKKKEVIITKKIGWK